MQLTPNFRLRKPDGTDPVDVKDLNDNMDVLDTEVAKKMDKTGDASNAVAKFSQAGSRTNLTSGEKLSLSLGKVMKWFADLKTVAFSGSYSDLSGKPSIPSGTAASCGVANNDTTTASGFVADARIVKIHGDEIDKVNQNLAQGQIEFDVDATGKGFYRKRGADTWLPFSNALVLMDGTGSYAFGGINNGYYSNFQLDNFDYSAYSKIRITNLGTYPFEVVCGTTSYTSPGTFDISALKQTTLRIFYRGAAANPPILLKVELIP